jgi:hypothetical protein
LITEGWTLQPDIQVRLNLQQEKRYFAPNAPNYQDLFAQRAPRKKNHSREKAADPDRHPADRYTMTSGS